MKGFDWKLRGRIGISHVLSCYDFQAVILLESPMFTSCFQLHELVAGCAQAQKRFSKDCFSLLSCYNTE